MSTMTKIALHPLPARKFSAVRRRAQHLGLTPAEYIQQLIEDDLALERKALDTPWEELAAPFRKALKGLSEAELDRLVDRARGRGAQRGRGMN